MATITTPHQQNETTHLDLAIGASSSPSILQPRARLMRLRWMEDNTSLSEYRLGSGSALEERLLKASKA